LKDEGQFEAETEVEFLNGACVLVKCEMLKKIGLLDEEFYLYGEDLDLCLRARKANYKLLYQPRAVIRHKISRSTPAFRKLRYRYQSWWRLCAKHTAFYWRPLQIANLALEFVPLMIGYLKRLLKFNSTLNTQNSKQ
jgi:GT2 family glycosyltransferase